MDHITDQLRNNNTSLTSVASLQDVTESMKPLSGSFPRWAGRTSIKSMFLVSSCHILTWRTQAGWAVTLWKFEIYLFNSLFNFPALERRNLNKKGWGFIIACVVYICMCVYILPRRYFGVTTLVHHDNECQTAVLFERGIPIPKYSVPE